MNNPEYEIPKRYFEWLCELVEGQGYKRVSFKKLLTCLHSVPFTYKIALDKNREIDGIELRYRFCLTCGIEECDEKGYSNYLEGPCSVLEMMAALALRCEAIMSDPEKGDRTKHWFWKMVISMGLGGCYDDVFDEEAVKKIIQRFLDRDYYPNGKGGLYTIRDCRVDLTKIEIWDQMMLFINTIT